MGTVPFLGVDAMIRWVAGRGAESIIRELTESLEAEFGRWEDFDKTARIASHSRDGVIELMPINDQTTYGFKYVNGHPSNPARGFQTVTAFGVLADVHNGYPVFVSEMTVLTALRTAATSALAVARQCSSLPVASSRWPSTTGPGSNPCERAFTRAASMSSTDTAHPTKPPCVMPCTPSGRGLDGSGWLGSGATTSR